MSEDLETLLEVQAHDTRLDQLRHKLDTLPERSARDAAAESLTEVEASIADAEAERSRLASDQKRIEDEVASLEAKRADQNDRLYGGTVTNARELQDLQEEIDGLSRRIVFIEDKQIEVMEQIEPIDAQLATLATTREGSAASLEGAEAALTVAEAEIAAEVDGVAIEREAIASKVPEPLLARYGALRAARGGIAIARLVGNQCGGCHLTLSAVEVAALRKHPDEAGTCEECGRLLVP